MHCIGDFGNSCEFWRLALEKPTEIHHNSGVSAVCANIMMDFCGVFQGKSSEFAWVPEIPYTMHPLKKSPILRSCLSVGVSTLPSPDAVLNWLMATPQFGNLQMGGGGQNVSCEFGVGGNVQSEASKTSFGGLRKWDLAGRCPFPLRKMTGCEQTGGGGNVS